MTLTTFAYILTAIVLPVLAWGFKLYRDMQKEKLTESQQKRLIAVAEAAVRAAEELNAKRCKDDKWTAKQKEAFAAKVITDAYPKLDKATVEVLIHAAIQAARLGASGKEK